MTGAAMARAPEFRAQHWLVGSVSGTIPGGRTAIVSARLQRAPATVINTEAAGGNFMINLYNINLTPTDPSNYQTWAPGDVVEIYIDPLLNGDFQSASTIRYTTASPASPGVEEVGTLTVIDAIATYGGPQLTVRALMEGYYNSAAGTQPPALVKVEARTGSGGPETATPGRLVETTFIRLDDTGTGRNGFPSETIARGDYYFVISHVPATSEAPAIHLPVITGTAANFGREGATNYDKTIDISDTASANYLAAYAPAGLLPAMLAVEDKRFLRVGDCDGNFLVQPGDYAVWRAAFDTGTYNLRADLDGDGDCDTGDYASWRAVFDNFNAPQPDVNCYVPR